MSSATKGRGPDEHQERQPDCHSRRRKHIEFMALVANGNILIAVDSLTQPDEIEDHRRDNLNEDAESGPPQPLNPVRNSQKTKQHKANHPHPDGVEDLRNPMSQKVAASGLNNW
ncbi:MAG: hypothetical protein HC884_19830 [Chloroflexaceae bacterium]|nr:hypothetical protein [Chloroflexaceae bacterium]